MAGHKGAGKFPAGVKMFHGTHRPSTDLQKPVNLGDDPPTCPQFLSKSAKTEWRRILKLLAPHDIVSAADRAALAVYCQSYGRWVQAEAALKAREELELEAGRPEGSAFLTITPNGHEQASALIGIADRAMERVVKYAREFGLTPSARQAVGLTEPNSNGKKKKGEQVLDRSGQPIV